ncbi:MAG: phosphoglycerate dehydrogenase, partial [Planctomycetota bacterium]
MPFSQIIAVTSPSFSQNSDLREHLLLRFSNTRFNETNRAFSPEELKTFLHGVDGAIVGLDPINDSLVSGLQSLKILSKFGVGLDNIDETALKKYNIALGWTPGINKRSVAELTLCFMIGLCRNIFETSFQLKQGNWNKSGGVQLSEKTIGIIGCGNVGADLLRLLVPFRCPVLIHDILDKTDICRETGAIQVSLSSLLDQSQLVTLHLPLTSKTKHFMNEKQLSIMRPDAFLINTSRGSIVDQAALKKALLEKKIAKAAIDVFEVEPPTDQEFLSLPNLIATPHIGGNAKEAVEAMGLSEPLARRAA